MKFEKCYLYFQIDKTVMIIGGNIPKTQGVEIMNLHIDGGICSQPANFANEVNFADGAVAAYINEMVLLCGGDVLLQRCLGYDFDHQTWKYLDFSLLEERIESDGLSWDGRHWMIIGGRSASNLPSSTSDVFNSTENNFASGPIWPVNFWGHCAVVINKTSGFIVGGKNTDAFIRSAYVMTLETGYWLWVGNLNHDRIGHVCGVLKHGSFDEIVVAGGMDQLAIEVFSFLVNKWRVLKTELPHQFNKAVAISYENSFVIIGGEHFGSCPIKPSECHSSKYIYSFNVENYDLEIRHSTMQTNRGNHLVVSLPKTEMCSKICSNCAGMGICIVSLYNLNLNIFVI